jgi:septum formation protein
MLPIYLASASPRRKALLEQIGLPFSILVRPVEEELKEGESYAQQVMFLAEMKARSAALVIAEGLVIGADTLVVCDGRVLGKPADLSEAEKMLSLLGGNEHEVYTGLAVVQKPSGRIITDYECTKVRFKSLNLDQIKRYAATGEPLDKAGAYAVQGIGAIFIDRIEGCYNNVVGLPLALLADILKEFGVDVLRDSHFVD